MKDNSKNKRAKVPVKAKYSPPVLTEYGSIEELTLGTGGADTDLDLTSMPN